MRTLLPELQQRFANGNPIHISRWTVDFLLLDSGDAHNLETPFSEEEIHKAIMDTEWNKASRLDEFSFRFVQSFFGSL